jgi:methylmalonyl-CoA/ethylmalonyl-CoA epimerase
VANRRPFLAEARQRIVTMIPFGRYGDVAEVARVVSVCDAGRRGGRMFTRISHIGVVVDDIERALRVWRDALGFKQFADVQFTVEGIRSVFLSVSGAAGEMSIELMEPIDKSDMTNPVARRLARRGEGFYHLAVVTDDVAASGRALTERSLPLIDRPPVRAGRQGRWLLHPKAASGVMIEAIEEWEDGTP